MKSLLLILPVLLFAFGCTESASSVVLNPGELPAVFDNGAYPAKDANGKYGFVNNQGKFIIPARYDEAEIFSEGVAAVRTDSLWGYIDTTGKEVLAPAFLDADPFSEGYAWVATPDSVFHLISREGNFAYTDSSLRFPFFHDHEIHPVKEGMVWILVRGGYLNCLNLQDSSVISFFPKSVASNFRDGLSVVANELIIDKKGKTVLDSLDWDGKKIKWNKIRWSQELKGWLAEVKQDNELFLLVATRAGKVRKVLSERVMDAFNFREGLCFVSIAPEDYAQKLAAESQEILYPDHLGFIDTTGQFRVGPFSNKWWIRSFQEGLSLVRDEWNKHGYIDVSGEWVIPPKYEYASPFYGGIAQASYYEGNKLRVCLIDRKGKEIYSFIR